MSVLEKHPEEEHAEEHPHHESFWTKYVFSQDHKVIGIQYALTSLVFLLFGFCLMLIMRWQLAFPGAPVPIIGGLLGEANAPGGIMLPEFYNQLGAMHGTIMVFMAIVPLLVGAFGNYVLPLQIGAPDMAFPKLNMASYWVYALGGAVMVVSFFIPGGAANSGWTSYAPLSVTATAGQTFWLLGMVGAFGNYVLPLQIGAPDMAFPKLNMASYWVYALGGAVMVVSFFIPGGAANSGWTSYAPLSVTATAGQTFWLLGMVCLITSSLLGSVNFITTTIQLRAKGLSFMRFPFFVWAQFVTAFLLLLAFPPLEAAGFMQLLDRVLDTSFFMPAGLVVSGEVQPYAGGGSPLLWQHLFWFLAHPEVYVLVLPAMGIVAEVIANNIRKPLWGYKAMVYSAIFLGAMSFIVWAHHMFMTGMGTTISAFFQTTTMIISVPSVVILTALFMSLKGGSIRFNTPMLFALAFLIMFGIGGLTGLPLGLSPTDIHLHDTYYVIGHFHYVVAPGTIFAIFAGIYYWFPKVTGRKMSELLGKIHFWPSLLFINGVFMPMFAQGLAGVSRRLYDGGDQYAHAQSVLGLNKMMSYSAYGLLLAQIPFIINFFLSMKRGQKVGANPWRATTLEWTAAPSPPVGHGNFPKIPVVTRGPYEYSVPGEPEDFTPQNAPGQEG